MIRVSCGRGLIRRAALGLFVGAAFGLIQTPQAVAQDSVGIAPAIGSFVRGDANGDSEVDISDPIWVLNYLFLGGNPPPCLTAADANDDGGVDLTDVISLITSLFLSGGPLPPPGPVPGFDPTVDLPCDSTV